MMLSDSQSDEDILGSADSVGGSEESLLMEDGELGSSEVDLLEVAGVDDTQDSDLDLLSAGEEELGGGGVSPLLEEVACPPPPLSGREFQWAFVVMSTLQALVPRIRQSFLFAAPTFATHFSGIGTAEQATRFLASAFAKCFDKELGIHFLSACESQRACQNILQSSLGGATCVFSNLLNLSCAGARCHAAALERNEQIAFSATWEALRREGLAPTSGLCLTHRAPCQRRHPMVDVSGSPCQPWSRMGRREGRTSHLTVMFLVWCLWVRNDQPLMLIHENVLGFDESMMLEMLGDLYDMVTLQVCPSDMGFTFIRRKRKYMVLWLRGRVRVITPMLAMYGAVRKAVQAACPRTCLSFCFVATQSDLVTAENKVRRRRGLPDVEQASRDWAYLLTPHQKARLECYSESWLGSRGQAPAESKSCVFNLLQNPEHRRVQTDCRGAMPTCTRGCSVLWVPFLRRWLLPIELAAAHGLPITQSLASDAQVALDVHGPEYSTSQLGNAMHVANVGSVLAITLSCLAPA